MIDATPKTTAALPSRPGSDPPASGQAIASTANASIATASMAMEAYR
jgi:hypothetical protein